VLREVAFGHVVLAASKAHAHREQPVCWPVVCAGGLILKLVQDLIPRQVPAGPGQAVPGNPRVRDPGSPAVWPGTINVISY
jgi:hypothetical protein